MLFFLRARLDFINTNKIRVNMPERNSYTTRFSFFLFHYTCFFVCNLNAPHMHTLPLYIFSSRLSHNLSQLISVLRSSLVARYSIPLLCIMHRFSFSVSVYAFVIYFNVYNKMFSLLKFVLNFYIN